MLSTAEDSDTVNRPAHGTLVDSQVTSAQHAVSSCSKTFTDKDKTAEIPNLSIACHNGSMYPDSSNLGN